MRTERPYWVHSQAAIPADEGQRPCARGEWCASAVITTLEDGTSRRDPAPGYQAFCPRDREHIARCLDEIPSLWVRLHTELGRKRARGDEHVSGSRQAPIPLRADVDALLRLITETLCSWEERVRVVARLTVMDTALSRHRRDGFATTQAVTLLGAHLDALLALPPEPMARTRPAGLVLEDLDGAAAGLEVLHLHYRCRSVLGETRAAPQELLGVPCRVCDMLALRRAEPPAHPDDPSWWSECAGCGDRMREDTYHDWVRLCAAYARQQRIPATLENLPGVA